MKATPPTPEELLARLVGFDTTSAKSNLALIDFVRAYLRDHGIDSELIPNEEGTKANMYATVGPLEPGGIALSGHTDVVPADAQEWQTDPFTLSARDGRLHGRGSCDMKGFLACVLALVPEMVAAKLTTPIHVAFSYDEEVGCTGVRPMIEALGAGLLKPRLAIVGEPTMMQVVNAHKSIQQFVTEVTGCEAHTSMTHLGANAIFATAEIIGEIARVRDALIADGDPSGRFTPPYSSIEIGCVSGGTAINIVPARCRLDWEMRGLPGIDPAAVLERVERFGLKTVLPKLRAISEDTDIETRLGIHVPELTPGADEPAQRLALRLTDRNDTLAVSYGTEAGLFQRAGIPTVVCGPGDIAVAHRPDEYIEKEQITACTRFLRRLVETVR